MYSNGIGIPGEQSGATSACTTCDCVKACFSDPRQRTESFFCLIKGHGIDTSLKEKTPDEIRDQILREAEENQHKVEAQHL